MTFTLSSGYKPIVAINSFSVSSSPPVGNNLPSNWASNPLSFQDDSEAELYTIDSSTPFLWMPPAVCDKVASALNLTYDDSLDVYLFDNNSSPADLVSWGLTFTFSLGNLRGDDDNVEITLPYSAFNLRLSYPFPNLNATFGSSPTSYFPLRRTSDSTQYAIGRAFLQETYLAVDYERNNFSISQAIFTEAAVNTVNLQSISRPDGSIWPGPEIPVDKSLSTGAQAGIGVAVAVAVLLTALGLWYFCFRRKRSKDDNSSEKSKRSSVFERLRRTPDSKSSVSELAADKHHPKEVPADSSNSRFELSSGSAPVEMAAAEEVSSNFLAPRGDQTGTSPRNDPRNPAELEPQDIRSKAAEAAAMADAHGSQRSASPVPPYSPNDSNDRQSGSVSPYTPRHSHGFGTISSGEAGISPVQHSSRGHSHPSSGSRADSSPVSPEDATQMTLPHSTEGSGTSSSGSSGRFGSLLVPQLNGRPPSRSPSTGSRFVEQGLSSVEEEEQQQQPPQPTPPPPATQATRPTMQRARFSWEQ